MFLFRPPQKPSKKWNFRPPQDTPTPLVGLCGGLKWWIEMGQCVHPRLGGRHGHGAGRDSVGSISRFLKSSFESSAYLAFYAGRAWAYLRASFSHRRCRPCSGSSFCLGCGPSVLASTNWPTNATEHGLSGHVRSHRRRRTGFSEKGSQYNKIIEWNRSAFSSEKYNCSTAQYSINSIQL